MAREYDIFVCWDCQIHIDLSAMDGSEDLDDLCPQCGSVVDRIEVLGDLDI